MACSTSFSSLRKAQRNLASAVPFERHWMALARCVLDLLEAVDLRRRDGVVAVALLQAAVVLEQVLPAGGCVGLLIG